jgi:hypothetical protein
VQQDECKANTDTDTLRTLITILQYLCAHRIATARPMLVRRGAGPGTRRFAARTYAYQGMNSFSDQQAAIDACKSKFGAASTLAMPADHDNDAAANCRLNADGRARRPHHVVSQSPAPHDRASQGGAADARPSSSRTATRSTKSLPACVPYLGAYLTDLTFHQGRQQGHPVQKSPR